MHQEDRAQHLAQRLDEALDAIADLIPKLTVMLPERDTGGPRTGTLNRGAPDGSEPWNPQVGDVLMTIWHGLGALVNAMRASLGMDQLHRPPSGPDALAAIRSYLPSVPEEVLDRVTRRCERWVRRAKELPAIDEAEPWASLPVMPALGHPPLCPYCGTTALRMRKRAGEVRCFFPGCEDGDGRPTRARMEAGRMTGESRLVFDDDTFMTFEGDDRA